MRSYLQARYGKHISLARIAFQAQPRVIEALGLKGKRKRSLEEWLAQASAFYQEALTHVNELAQYGVPQLEIVECQKMMDQLVALSALQKQSLSRAQVLTQKKQEARTQLEEWYRKMIRTARMALEEEPQLLEALGIVV